MKKILFIIIINLGFNSLKAQNTIKGNIDINPYLGYIQSFFNGDSVENLNKRHAIRFGINGDYFFNSRWSIRTGVNYDSMGVNSLSSKVTLIYLNIPINANWHFGSTRNWNFNFGFTSGFLLNANTNGTDIKNEVESIQVGISYGIGYKLPLSKNFGFLIDIQGLSGVSNIINEDVVGQINRTNAGSSFNIGAVFKL